MSWLIEFPELNRETLITIRKALDSSYREFSRAYGDNIENFFDPLLYFLVWFEKVLQTMPWWIVIAIVALVSHLAAKSWRLTIGIIVTLFLIGFFGMWEDTMSTLSIVTVSTCLSVMLGIPIGILMARSNRTQTIITPVLDVMQTMPAFVYLIPIVMLLGIGKIPGIMAVIIYAIPPVIRLTNLGIRLVDKEVLEAAISYGVTPWQKLWNVQLPLALPTIMAGVNQTIMMALAMVVIASMIGVTGLGQPVLRSITNQHFALGLFNGLAIVALAIIFDRVSQAYAKRSQRHLGGNK